MRKTFLYSVLLLLVMLPATPARAETPPSMAAGRLQVDTDPYSMINEVNALRAANGLAPYAVNSILMSIAQTHAQYMSVNGVSHYGPGGTRGYQRALAAGYPLAGDLSLGGFFSENIQAGNNLSVQAAVIAWQGDAPHLHTMLSADLQEIGAGVALVGDYAYYVIDCARPTSSGQSQNTPAPGVTQPAGIVSAPLARTIVPATPNAEGKLIHLVKPGETLWLIAISYGVKIADIRRLNNMTEAEAIYPGDKLLIKLGVTPAPQATETLAATSTSAVDLVSTIAPTWTPLPLPTLLPTETPIPVPTAGVKVQSKSSKLVLAAIVSAALVLAAIFVRAGRKE